MRPWTSSTCTAPSLAPGFVDSHVHLTETGIALDALQLGGVRSAAGILDAVAAAVAGFSDADATVLGHGWDESRWDDQALPSREELERAAGGRRVYLSRVDAHSALVSSSLAEAAGLAGLDGFSAGSQVKRHAHTSARLAARQLPDSVLRSYQGRALAEVGRKRLRGRGRNGRTAYRQHRRPADRSRVEQPGCFREARA